MASSVRAQAAPYRRLATISASNQIVNSWCVLFWPIGRFIMVSPSFSHLHFSFKHRLLTVAGCLATVDGIFLADSTFLYGKYIEDPQAITRNKSTHRARLFCLYTCRVV